MIILIIIGSSQRAIELVNSILTALSIYLPLFLFFALCFFISSPLLFFRPLFRNRVLDVYQHIYKFVYNLYRMEFICLPASVPVYLCVYKPNLCLSSILLPIPPDRSLLAYVRYLCLFFCWYVCMNLFNSDE